MYSLIKARHKRAATNVLCDSSVSTHYSKGTDEVSPNTQSDLQMTKRNSSTSSTSSMPTTTTGKRCKSSFSSWPSTLTPLRLCPRSSPAIPLNANLDHHHLGEVKAEPFMLTIPFPVPEPIQQKKGPEQVPAGIVWNNMKGWAQSKSLGHKGTRSESHPKQRHGLLKARPGQASSRCLDGG